MFTSKELNTFICVAEKMSIKVAAEELNITSPAVCSMIRKLENRINNKLFNFKNNKMNLTQYGKNLYSLTESHFHTLKSIEIKLRGNGDMIKIYIGEDLLFLAPFLMTQFKMKGKEVILTQCSDESADVLIINNTCKTEGRYKTFVKKLYFYMVHNPRLICEDVLIHKEHYPLLNKYLTTGIVNEVEQVTGFKSELHVSNGFNSIMESVLNSMGLCILPHTCAILKFLHKSMSDISIKRFHTSVPIYFYVSNGVILEMINLFFDDTVWL
ncbi:TPA: LysR family transcriptional regulator [Serratia marcescens]|nr:LysR family transcriptional regulator [Serratia marcescens]